MNDAMQDTQKPSKWKTVLVKSVGVGLGIGVGVCLVLWLAYYITSTPKAWDKDAIKSTTGKVMIVQLLNSATNRPDDPRKGELWVPLVLANQTSSDYELEDGLDVMEVSRGNDAISESNAKTKKVFIPAHHSAETHLQIDVYCKFVDDNGKDIPGAYDDCYKNWVDEHKGLVVFDQAKRYEIRADLPKSMSKMD